MKNGWKRWIRGWSLIVILLSVLSVSGCSVSEEDGLQEVTEKVSQEPESSLPASAPGSWNESHLPSLQETYSHPDEIQACRRNTWVQCVKAIGKDSLHVEYRAYSVFLKPIGICAILSAS